MKLQIFQMEASNQFRALAGKNPLPFTGKNTGYDHHSPSEREEKKLQQPLSQHRNISLTQLLTK